ncbi:RWD domain-containing protein 4-like isoform X2 [Asterias amurensis]|uniref:RWD domain-containing protein 4-like isoform X2 n=1 Tax=Asterias amurensis TaxID=7602 RepID=UPI003AB16E84
MSCQESQEEEKEVLLSIYDGDECFKLIDSTYQYRVGDEGHFKSFMLEIKWGDNYPEEFPEISLNTFYNNHLQDDIRSSVVEKVKAEAEQWLGCAMTYTLFEWAKENAEDLMAEQTEAQMTVRSSSNTEQAVAKQKEKKEQLTKAQKRKIANRTDHRGDLPRGFDWVDIVKHLSRTGFSKTQEGEKES